MILEIDAGNSRIKWRLVEAQEISVDATTNDITEGSVITVSLDSGVLEEFLHQLDELPGDKINRIRVSNVRGEEFCDCFTSHVVALWQLQPEFARVEKCCAGVTNAYEEINSMGVDRWLAMLAAFNKVKTACCILDCGSAITFDWIDHSGMHQGGFIVPGFHLMQHSLALKTPALITESADWKSTAPGNSTKSGISNGIMAMITGFTDFCQRQTGKSGQDIHWFLTGGDAEILANHLDWAYQLQKDLVLDGLALAMP